mgnify:CR=1 FL=1
MVRVGGPRVSHGTITVNSVRVVTVISVGGGYSSHPGLRRGPGVGSVRSGSSGWSPVRGRLPSGLFDNFNMIIALSQNYFKTSLISA